MSTPTHPSGNWQDRLLGRYHIERSLGHGSLSEVWLATDTQLRRQVALKILPAALASDQNYLQAFTSEARAAASLEHPHILGIHDFGEEEIKSGQVVPYLVMPYVPGGTLKDRLLNASGPLSPQESLRYLRQAALALDYAHSQQILHRNLKPANMLLREDWLLLTDFGLARLLGNTTARGKLADEIDDPEYLAPEQITGEAQPASDRYSLAVVAYQLLTGRQPFRAESPSATLTNVSQGSFRPARELNPMLPPRVESLLSQALSRDIQQRPPSCLALVDTLQRAWMSGIPTENQADPDATLLAPWNKQIQTSSTNLPVATSDPNATGWMVSNSGLSLSSPVLPVSHPLETTNNNNTPFLSNSQGTTSDFGTKTDRSGEQNAFRVNSAPADNELPPIQFTQGPKTFEQRVGRRTILIGGGIAAAAVITGGVLGYDYLQSHSRQTGPVSSTPVPGPKRLIAGRPLLALTGHSKEVWEVSWSPEGRYLMTAGADTYIMLWDIDSALKQNIPGTNLSTPLQKWSITGINYANSTDNVCWTGDGTKLVATTVAVNKTYVIDAFKTASKPTIYNNADATITDAYVSYVGLLPGPGKDKFTALNQANSGTLAEVWKIGQTDAPIITYDASDDVWMGSWSNDGNTLAGLTGGFSTQNALYLWKKTDRLHPKIMKRPDRGSDLTFFTMVDTLAWSPSDPNILLASDADVGLIWDIRQNKPSLILNGKKSDNFPVTSKFAWSPNGRYVVCSYNPPGDGSSTILSNPPILIWDVQTLLKGGASDTPKPPTTSFTSPGGLQHSQTIIDIDWSPDGKYLATTSFDKTVIIWQVDGA